MNLAKNIFFILFIALLGFSCTKKETMKSDLDTLRNNTNSTAYPSVQMDSTQAINAITKQKVQELLDLSLIYANGNKTPALTL
jgi:hypothetical protein